MYGKLGITVRLLERNRQIYKKEGREGGMNMNESDVE